MSQEHRSTWSLLLLRVGVFVVMLFWTLDKFVQPEHSGRVFEGFYGIGGLGNNVFYIIGVLEMALIVAFVTGSWKRISYGLVFPRVAESLREHQTPAIADAVRMDLASPRPIKEELTQFTGAHRSDKYDTVRFLAASATPGEGWSGTALYKIGQLGYG